MYPMYKAVLLPLLALAGLVLIHARAQEQVVVPTSPNAPGPRPDPVDPKASVPEARYRSALSTYQTFAEPQVAPWRETNERVRQRGGWRAYAREAREPDAAQPAASTASQPAGAAKPAAGGHSGHPMK